MGWETIALKTAGMILGVPGVGITDSLTAADLQQALDDAVAKINQNTIKAILDSKIDDLRANIDNLYTSLKEYKNAPTVGLLESATALANSLVSNCKDLGIEIPHGPGLAGHPYFLIAVNLKVAVLQERVKFFGPADNKNITDLLISSIAWAENCEAGWWDWNERRFGDVCLDNFMALGLNWVYHFHYTFDQKEQKFTLKSPIAKPINLESIHLKAQAKRANHIAIENAKIYKAYVEPSMDVVAEWKKYLPKTDLSPAFLKAFTEALTIGKEYRRSAVLKREYDAILKKPA